MKGYLWCLPPLGFVAFGLLFGTVEPVTWQNIVAIVGLIWTFGIAVEKNM